LTAQDLTDHPVWEFYSDEEGADDQDEATVRPSATLSVADEAGVYVFATDVLYADGQSGVGYRYSGNTSEWGTIQPCVVTAQGQVNFWFGMLRFVDVEAVKKDAYAKLRKHPEQVFPLKFVTRVPTDGLCQMVRVDGFRGLDELQRVSSFR